MPAPKSLLPVLLASITACTHQAPPSLTTLPPVTKASATVVRPAPDLTFRSANSTKSLSSLRGHPILLLLGDKASRSRVTDQAQLLEGFYSKLAARKMIFLSAFTDPTDNQVRSNVPFTPVEDPLATVASYKALAQASTGSPQTPTVAIIGPDGNVDYIGEKLLSGERVREIMLNNHSVQTKSRRPIE